jgi:hypothetical protein
VSWVEVETESKSVHTPFGDNPAGVITYTADGRMSLFIVDAKRKPPSGPKATDAEANELYRTMVAYSGAYSIEGNKKSFTKSNTRGIRHGPEPVNSASWT